MSIIVLMKTDPTTKEQSYKQDMVDAKSADNIEMIFKLWEGFFEGF